MSFIAYKKRKEIAEGARRASDYVRRASQKMRASISGRGSNAGDDKEKPVNNVQKDMLEMQNQADPQAPTADKGEEIHQFEADKKDEIAKDIDTKEEVAGNIMG